MKCLSYFKNMFRNKEFFIYRHKLLHFRLSTSSKGENIGFKDNILDSNIIISEYYNGTNELKLKLTNSKEILSISSNLNSEMKKENINLNSSFFLILTKYSLMVDYVSINNFKVLYQNDKLLFDRINSLIINQEIKIDNSIKAKAVLSFIYLLEVKKTYNMTRQENDMIIPKILHQIDKHFCEFDINELCELVMMLAHFGVNSNMSKIERKLKSDFSKISYKSISNVIRGLIKSKNNKMNDFKAKFISLLIQPYLIIFKNESLDNQISSLCLLISIQNQLPLVNLKYDLDNLFEKIINNLNDGVDITIQSAMNLIQGINYYFTSYRVTKSNVKIDILLKLIYDKIVLNLSLHNQKEIHEKINLPKFFVFVKNLDFIVDTNLLPQVEHMKAFYKYIEKEIPFYLKKNLIIKESLYLISLMSKTDICNNLNEEIFELIYLYTFKQMHLINLNEKSLKDYIMILKRRDSLKYQLKLNSILENIDNIICRSENDISILFAFDLFAKSCFFSELDANNNIVKRSFNLFSEKLQSISIYDSNKIYMNLLDKYVNEYQFFIPREFKLPLIEKLISNINIYEVALFKFSIIKLFIDLNEIKVDLYENKSLQIKIEKLISLILKETNLYNFSKGLKILGENKNLEITDNTLNLINNVIISKNQNLKENQNYEENIVLFCYILLKDKKTHNIDLINSIFVNLNPNFLKSDFCFNTTLQILQTFTHNDINYKGLIKLFQDQLYKKLITSKHELNLNEITELIKQLVTKRFINRNSISILN